jgi:hypothetical protein
MLRCAESFVIVAYEWYASFLRICAPCLRTFYEAINIPNHLKFGSEFLQELQRN